MASAKSNDEEWEVLSRNDPNGKTTGGYRMRLFVCEDRS